MGSLTVNIEDEAWRIRNQRMQTLIARHYKPAKEVDRKMDPIFYESAKGINVDAFIDDLERVSEDKRVDLTRIIFEQETPSGNSLLHVAASNGSKDVTELLAFHFPYLITKKNFQGNTAIHLAAREGKLETVTTLLNSVENNEKAALLNLRNEKGNTPLHEAVINEKHKVAEHLIWAEPQVAYCQNDDGVREGQIMRNGKSPLYIAAEYGDEQMLELLLKAIVQHGEESLNKLNGISPAHAAVKKKRKGFLEKIAEIKPELLRAKGFGDNNALHFASYSGYIEGVRLLLEKYSDGAIEKNEDGLYPIHVACTRGKLEVVKELLKQWPDPAEFLNNQGQNILHVAAEHGREFVVSHILSDPNLVNLADQKDKDGNTPLHLATKQNRLFTVYALTKANVNKFIVNDDNLTPYGEAKKQIKQLDEDHENAISNKENQKGGSDTSNKWKMGSKDVDVYGMMMTYSVLFFYGNSSTHQTKNFVRVKAKPLSKDEIKSRVEVLLVAAVLVAGAAFNGACQVPKNVIDSDDNTKNLTNNSNPNSKNKTMSDEDNLTNILLHFYFLFDFLALNSSIAAATILCWVQLYDVKLATLIIWLGSVLVWSSYYLMFFAFLFAVALGAIKINLIFVSIFVVGAIFLLIHSVLSIPLFMPPSANKIIENFFSPYVYIIFFWCYFLVKRIFAAQGKLLRLEST